MASFTSRLRNENNQSTSSSFDEELSRKTKGFGPIFKNLVTYQSKTDSLKKSLLRIIGIIVGAALVVGIYELLA